MSASIGTFGQFGVGASSTVDTRLNYRDETFIRDTEVIDGNGNRGTRSSAIELTRDSIQRIQGPVNLIPTAVEWDTILTWAMGAQSGATSGRSITLSETAVTKYVTIDRVIKVFNYVGVGVDRMTLRATKGGPLMCTLNLVGQTETVNNSGTFPSLTLDITTGPFIFTDLALSVNSTVVNCEEFSLVLDNKIDKDRFLNSLTLTAVNALDREVHFSTSLPYGDYSAIYTAQTGGTPGIAVSATFTNGNTSMAITLPAVSLPKRAPQTPFRREIMLPLEGRAYKASTTAEMAITLDSAP